MRANWLELAVCGFLALGVLGCGGGSARRELASQYLLGQEPADAQSVLDLEEATAALGDVTLVGRIGGVPDPWTKGQAAFVIADPSLAAADEHEHGHACGEDCPYCKNKRAGQPATSGLALVQVVDAEGRVLPVDARELFQLELDQTVVVRGRAERNTEGHLIVAARGLYVRR